MAKRRRFTPEFKAEVVIEALSGESSQAELCRKPYTSGKINSPSGQFITKCITKNARIRR